MQESGIAVAEIDLARGRGRQVDERCFGNAIGAVAATGEPHRVDGRIGHDLSQRRKPRLVGAGEVPLRQEALRMNDQLALAAPRDDGLHGVGSFPLQCATGGHDRDAHPRFRPSR